MGEMVMGDLTPDQFRLHLASAISDPEFIRRAVADYTATYGKKRAEPAARYVVDVEPAKSAEDLHEDRMAEGSNTLRDAVLALMQGQVVSTPRTLIWRHTTAEMLPHNATARWREYEPRIEPVRAAPRDPCPRCGTRADIGCKHKRIA